MYSYGGKDDHWTVPALLDYSAPISIGTKYIYIGRDLNIFPNKILDKENPKYGQVTIATERNNWKPKAGVKLLSTDCYVEMASEVIDKSMEFLQTALSTFNE